MIKERLTSKEKNEIRRGRVAIIHPDLGIGGAEQLIVNVALALKYKNYQVQVFTPFFDPNRCFEEAK